jgi:hypothetical protein
MPSQRAVDLLYIALTRARERLAVLSLDEPTFLLEDAIKRGLLPGVDVRPTAAPAFAATGPA